MEKHNTTPSSPLWRGAAQRRGGQSGQETIATLPHTLSLVIASAAKQSSNNNARAHARDSIHLDPGVKPQDDTPFFFLKQTTK